MKERQIVFQAWLWRLNEIPVEEVAKQGFTAIQTSPLQYAKEKIHENLDNAWAIYQPINYDIGNDLGTVEDLRNLANRCHANGLKLVVDVVFHHVANEKGNDISHLVPDEYRHFYNDSFINIRDYQNEYERNGMNCVGHNPESNLVEIVEIPGLTWYIGTQFHPEYQSTVLNPHPLFLDFIKTVIKHKKK